eukprot:jgi/Ulvmu1/8955/UM005_0046.1
MVQNCQLRHLGSIRRAAFGRKCNTRPRCTSATNVASQTQLKANTRQATFTHYGCNAWTLEFNDSKVKFLVDPWLVDTLSFADQKWLLEGTKVNPPSIADVLEGVSFVVLSQYLDDHTHKPTLKLLPKNLTVVAQPEAAVVARQLGFTDVIELDHGQEVTMADGKIVLQATPGALVGPPWSKRQNALVIRENTNVSDLSIFYEPHASHDQAALESIGSVDIAIIPTRSAYAMGYPVVEGDQNAQNILTTLKPSIVVPFKNNESSYSGIAAGLLSSSGSDDINAVKQRLQNASLDDITVVGTERIGQPVQLLA